MIRITDHLAVNPAHVRSVKLDQRFYMNGSDTYLVVEMDDGKTHRISRDEADIYKIHNELVAA